jgi:ATP-dependent RNA helicase RhlE
MTAWRGIESDTLAISIQGKIVTTFQELGLSRPILQALASENYTTPTPIQAQAIPHVRAGRDLLGVAQTGTGKTAAFALPIIERLAGEPKRPLRRACRCLVLSPTRELASQIAESFRVYGKNLRLSVAVVFGGVSVGKQIRELSQGVDILVATPGRLLDVMGQGALLLDAVEIVVLDEADQMLDMGFIRDIRKIVAALPKKRQSLFFSATMPKEIGELAGGFLTDPLKVAVAPVATTAERVDQRVVHVESARKQPLLEALLADETIDRALVFTRTKHGADRVVRRLLQANFSAAAIHGNKSQSQRERALADFKAGRVRLLVATDIAARGIDIDNVSHVLNFDLPNVAESYVHRIGRTARAGAAGIAISFCDREESAFLRDIERLTRQKVPVMVLPEGFRAHATPEQRPAAPRQSIRETRGRPQSRRPAPSSRAGHGGHGQAMPAQKHARGEGSDGAHALSHWNKGPAAGRGRAGSRRQPR